MCGIVGVWRRKGERLSRPHLDRLGETIAERGPDGAGSWVHEKLNLGFAHRRLAIIDLSPLGAQPMTSPSGRLTIVFNGEIYNYRELKAELESAGAAFRGASDTAVLLAAIENWGLAPALSRAEGMFAFGLWDERARTLTLARDRFGEKPLYFTADNAGIAFASGLRPLLAEGGRDFVLDRQAAWQLLSIGFAPNGRSIFRNVAKLAPGSWTSFEERDGGFVRTAGTYWNAREVLGAGMVRPALSPGGAIERLEELLAGAVARACRADVPYGAFLSGGIDSSLVVALMKRHLNKAPRSFTIGFDDPLYDESPAARLAVAALETDHTEIRLGESDIAGATARLPEFCDEPVVDPAIVPTYLLARETRRHVTVALTGDGGDELFAGYTRHVANARLARIERKWGRVAVRGIAAAAGLARKSGAEHVLRRLSRGGAGAAHGWAEKLSRLAALTSSDAEVYYAQVLTTAPPMRALSPALSGAAAAFPMKLDGPGSALARLRMADIEGYLPDEVLQKADRATMAVGLEGRAPLLAASVAEFALALPDEALVANGQGKAILRHLAARLLPAGLARRPKAGFAPPLRRWLSGPLNALARDTLLSSGRRGDFFATAGIESAFRRLQANDPAAALFLWRALCIQRWADHYLGGSPIRGA